MNTLCWLRVIGDTLFAFGAFAFVAFMAVWRGSRARSGRPGGSPAPRRATRERRRPPAVIPPSIRPSRARCRPFVSGGGNSMRA